ncbi:hypothetical protein [Pseudooceanicola sp. LIPI14-2-Ac024]|uniref:hypothetical protein n=1 Tax=Pseudooceanicola sp. LIPI14-2-Ac024 TaxID=3344875 RepID=UPI0035D057D2
MRLGGTIAIGVLIGVAIGLATGSPWLWTAIGAGVGLVLAILRHDKDQDEATDDGDPD